MSERVEAARRILRIALGCAVMASPATHLPLQANDILTRVLEAPPIRTLGIHSPSAAKFLVVSARTFDQSERQLDSLELARTGLNENHDSALGPVSSGGMILDGREIACRAVRNWTPSKVLRARARTLTQAFCDEEECSKQAAQSLANFLNMQANHQEDIGAANALRAYYTRLSVREQLQLSEVSLQLVQQEMSKQKAALQAGLATGVDYSNFERQRIEIRDQQLQLESQDRQLQTLLAHLSQINYQMKDFRQEQLEVIVSPLNCERLKQIAIAGRHDIRSWTYLANRVNDTSSPLFAKMLPSLIGGFSLPMPAIMGIKALLCPPDYSRLSANIKQELNLTIDMHRQWIEQAVDEKCSKLQMAYARIDLAQQTVASWNRRLSQLEQMEKAGESVPAQTMAARVGLLKARSEEVSRRLEARIAEIDLAEAAGRLAGRCCEGQPWLMTGYE